jgi:hypothetical protein
MATVVPHQEYAEHASSHRAERTALRYLAVFALIGVVLYAIPFIAERIPSVQPYSGSDWGLILDNSYNLRNTNADVVIFGDSSALYGIDTPRLSAQLGLKVINLPQSIGSLVVSGDLTLRKYMAENRPPRIIVFYLTPWNLDFNSASDEHSYEGMEQMVRHGSRAELLGILRTKPQRLLSFPLSFYLVPSKLTQLWDMSSGIHTLTHAGFLPYPVTAFSPITGDCVIPSKLLNLTSDRSLQKLRTSFGPAGAEMITILAPIPKCAGAQQLADLLGSSLTVMPSQDFVDDAFLVHLLASHTDETTDRVAAVLRKSLAPPQ